MSNYLASKIVQFSRLDITSKYNPIEHRLFPHLSRACKGVIFDSVNTVANAKPQQHLEL
ncbi:MULTISPECIES: hypothetical protein [Nostocales]|uniref:ISAzo13-like element transposase-related protein n=1 Tax=Nostocales TaxID=1161 RepID=UPI000A453F0C|nr:MULTISPECIES: hypothetical protein [Nostocales]MCX5981451.1 hypothetical protein [Nostocales cyanobacterium LacPavin_0920_SED1_MAG_38_18]